MTDAIAGETSVEPEVTAVAPVLDEAPGEVTPPDPADVDAPAEPVPPVPPGPEAIAEIEAASPQAPEAVEGFRPDLGETTPEVVSEGEASLPPEADAPALPEIEYPIGSTRQAILDHFIDSEGDRSMSQIKAAMPHVVPTTVEASVRREWEAGRLLRISPGIYRLAPAKPAEQPKSPKPPPEPPKVREDGHTAEEWFAALESWLVDPSTWDVAKLGPPADEHDHRIPTDIATRFEDRLRKRAERRKDREACAARQAAADAELLAKLKDATGGNFTPGPGIDDVAPIRVALELVPLDDILRAIRHRTDRKCCPKNEPATSWREPRLLKAIAEDYCRYLVAPSLVAAWAAAKAPGKRAAAPAAVVDASIVGAPETAPEQPVQRAEASPGTQGVRGTGKRTSSATATA